MTAIYYDPPNCQPCLDLYPDDIHPEICKKCMSDRKYKVDILEFGLGLFRNKALIQFEDGSLDIVPLKKLTVCKKGEGNEKNK